MSWIFSKFSGWTARKNRKYGWQESHTMYGEEHFQPTWSSTNHILSWIWTKRTLLLPPWLDFCPCYNNLVHFQDSVLVLIHTPGWKEALWQWNGLPKNTTLWSRTGLNPDFLTLVCIALGYHALQDYPYFYTLPLTF